MEPGGLPRKLVAILYADVAGYSRLTGEDEDGTHRRLSEYLDFISATIEERPGWRSVGGMPVYQMVCQQPKLDGVEPLGRELGAADVAGMRSLTKLTDPGPFLEETIAMGRYLGVEEGGQLVAMAGERFRLDGWVLSLTEARLYALAALVSSR